MALLAFCLGGSYLKRVVRALGGVGAREPEFRLDHGSRNPVSLFRYSRIIAHRQFHARGSPSRTDIRHAPCKYGLMSDA